MPTKNDNEDYICIHRSKTHLFIISSFASVLAYDLTKKLRRKNSITKEKLDKNFNEVCNLMLLGYKKQIIELAIAICSEELNKKIEIVEE